MRLKGIGIATGVLLILAVGGLLIKKAMEPSRVAGRVGQSLMAGVDLGQVTSLGIVKDKEQVTLTAGEGGWRVEEQQNFPANEEKIRAFLLKLGKQIIAHQVTEKPERLGSLGLLTIAETGGKFENQKTAALITLKGEGAKTLVTILLGNDRRADPNQANAFGGQYVRFPDKPTAYLIGESFYLDSASNRWLESKLFSFDHAKDIKSVRISHAKEKLLVFSRAEQKAPWKLAGSPEVDQEQVNFLMERVGGISINRVAKPDQDAKSLGRETLATLEVELFDGRRYRLTVGEKKVEDDDLRYITAGAELASSAKDKGLQKEVDAFNARLQGRFTALYDWEAKNIFKVRKELLPKKK